LKSSGDPKREAVVTQNREVVVNQNREDKQTQKGTNNNYQNHKTQTNSQ